MCRVIKYNNIEYVTTRILAYCCFLVIGVQALATCVASVISATYTASAERLADGASRLREADGDTGIWDFCTFCEFSKLTN